MKFEIWVRLAMIRGIRDVVFTFIRLRTSARCRFGPRVILLDEVLLQSMGNQSSGF